MKNREELVIKKVNISRFYEKSINEYNEYFKDLKNRSIIKSNNFSDKLWILDETYNNSGFIHKLDFTNISSKYELIIKCLVLNKLNDIDDKIQPETLVARYRYLINILERINSFSINNIEKFKDYLELISHKMAAIAKIQTAIIDYYEFTDDENVIEFLNITSQYYDDLVGRKARDLPDYKSILIFDTKINSLFPYFNGELKLKYYLIYLWWKITMIIPLRPNEFLNLKYNCCWQDEDGRFWLKVPRSKVKDTNAQIKLVDTLECNEKIFNIISSYKNFIENYVDKSDYLIPYKLKYMFFNNMNKANADIKRIDKEKQNNNDGNNLLRQFEENYLAQEIQNGQYSHITLGDSRHFAFCNMILQGYNPLVIAQIGGHTKLESQLHYYQHIETCTNAYIKELAYRFRLRNHKIISSINTYSREEYKSRTLLKLYNSTDIDNFLEIEKGYCTKYKKNSPNIGFENCCENCFMCNYHIMNFEKYPEMKEYLLNKSSEYQNILDKQMKLVKEMSKEMKIDYKLNQVDPIANKELGETGKNLINDINKKAIIDGNLLDFILENKEEIK